jgi:hypothetical protein
MIKTVGELRKALDDAPDTMELRVMIQRGILVKLEQVMWQDERCVLAAHVLTLQPQKEKNDGEPSESETRTAA